MPDYTFDKKSRTYFKNGRPVKAATLKAWTADVLERAREEMGKATDSFIAGSINRPAWFLEMRGLIARSHGAMWMLAQGGRNAMDEKAWGKAGNRIKSELAYLRNFEREIANDEAGSELEIAARGRLYANALHASYAAAVVARERAAGVKRVVRVLDAGAENCRDCPDLAGEFDIDSVPEIGASECGNSCRCEIVSVEG